MQHSCKNAEELAVLGAPVNVEGITPTDGEGPAVRQDQGHCALDGFLYF